MKTNGMESGGGVLDVPQKPGLTEVEGTFLTGLAKNTIAAPGNVQAKTWSSLGLEQWFSTFRMPRPFNIAHHVVVILPPPNHTIIFVATS